MALSDTILEQAKALTEEMRSWRRTLHRHPELGLDTQWTKAFIAEHLTEMGYVPKKVGDAGYTVLAGKPGGKVILLRADMDALPLQEASGEEFSSENPGQMHACGHDLHTAMLLGAARLLKANESLLEGQVKLMFQSGEESGEGAKNMVEAGVLEDPHVDAAEMIHVAAGAPFPTGMVLIPQGGTGASASCRFQINVTGKGGHGAMPASCIDPITAICHIHSGLEEIYAREAELCDYLTITVGSIHAGDAPNIIPNSAQMQGTIRTMTLEKMNWAQQRIQEIAEGIGAAYRTKAEVVYEKLLPPLIADTETADCAGKYMQELLGKAAMRVPSDMKGGGSEDFAYVSVHTPSAPMFLAAGNSKEGYRYSVHHPEVRFDERALPVGAAAHCYFAIRWLQEHK
ncbi:MAG: amidohydrolase [Lachnospiraceae bacterium]|nr:amidohydrolase [Lachnospiraceae bacterium]